MSRKAGIALALIMLAIVAWALMLEAGSTRIVINGQELTGPLGGTIGAAGLITGLIALFCAAIFLLFAIAGVGVLILGGVIVVGLVVAGATFPFLLILLLPMAIVWAYVTITRRTGA